MLGFIGYITCYSCTVDRHIFVRCALALSKFQFAFILTTSFAFRIF